MAAVSSMSKKRYQEIADKLANIIGDQDKLEEAMASIREIMKFDPDKSSYTPEHGQKVLSRRHKLRDEQGISTYISSGRKKHYINHKSVHAILA